MVQYFISFPYDQKNIGNYFTPAQGISDLRKINQAMIEIAEQTAIIPPKPRTTFPQDKEATAIPILPKRVKVVLRMADMEPASPCVVPLRYWY